MNNEKFVKGKSVTKSMQFEIIPQGNTRKFLDERHIIENDKQLKEMAAKVKVVGDCFIRHYFHQSDHRL